MRKSMIVVLSLLLCASWGMSALAGDTEKTKNRGPSGLFQLYEQNRQEDIPNYITLDFLLLSYSMIRQQDTEVVEKNSVLPEFKNLLAELEKSISKEKDEISQANRDYISVVSALINGVEKKAVLKSAGKRAAAELELVLSAKGVVKSPLWGYSIDYSQFRPRGSYSADPERSRYFQAMSYSSAVLFAVKPSKATGIDEKLADRLAGQAIQLVASIAGNEVALESYNKINSTLEFRFGQADDLIFSDLLSVVDAKAGEISATREVLYTLAEEKGRKPRILSGIVNRDLLEKDVKPAEVLVGWRLFPQRYSADSAMFQLLVSPEAGTLVGNGEPFGLAVVGAKPVKGFPSSYELMAALGSKEAASFLEEKGENKFSGYSLVSEAGRKELAQAEGLDALHGVLLRTLLAGEDDSNAGTRLTAGKAFWTWQRYVNLLYTKQSVTMAGKSISLDSQRKGAYLENALPVYLALHRVVMEQSRRMDGEKWGNWDKFEQVVSRCIEIASRQALEVENSPEDDAFLNSLDTLLVGLTGGKDLPIVVDVHTEPSSGQVVEEAVGAPIVVTSANKARGARMSHFEFKHPLTDRLTDEKWRQMILSDSIPAWK